MKINKLTLRSVIFSFLLILLGLISCTRKSSIFENGDAFVNEVIESVEGINSNEAKMMMDTASYYILLDVREPNEHHPGYIPGSVNIPRGVLEFKFSNPDFWESQSLYPPYKEDLILVYCKKGKRSVLATSTLQKMGYNNIKYLEGGFKQWELSYPNDYERDEIDLGHAEEAEEVGGC